MELWMKAALVLAVFNLITFAVYGADKYKAVHGKWRVPERTLIALALCGGSIGALLGMQCFHHKTKKKLFYIGVPLILLLQVMVIGYIIWMKYF